MQRANVIWSEAESPIGLLLFAATSKGLCFLTFQGEKTREVALVKLRHKVSKWLAGLIYLLKDERAMEPYMKQVDEYFAKKRQIFDMPIDLLGTPFQRTVWSQLQEIPYGECYSYKQIAMKIGRPRAARAVGRANNQNPIAIVCPCHRVVGADGSLVGYGGGLERKRYLLNHEGWEGKLKK